MSDHQIRLKNVVLFSGAFCAYFMGAAFASGQEMLQFFAAFGSKGFAGIALTLLILIFAGFQIQVVSHREQFKEPADIFIYLCGRYVGSLYSYLLVILLYAECTMMIAGAGAVFEEHFGFDGFWGRGILVLIVVFTVLLGLNKIVNILGFVGPLIILFMIFVAIAAIVQGPYSIAQGSLLAANIEFTKGAATWYASGAKYVSYVVLSIVPIWAVCGLRSTSLMEARATAITEVVLLGIPCLTVITALIKNIELVAGKQIPNLLLAKAYAPEVALIFAVVLMFGLYTPIVFELWYTVRKFAEEQTIRYKMLTIVLGGLSFLLSGLLPFDRIINYLYTCAYWLGVVFLTALIVRMVSRWLVHGYGMGNGPKAHSVGNDLQADDHDSETV